VVDGQFEEKHGGEEVRKTKRASNRVPRASSRRLLRVREGASGISKIKIKTKRDTRRVWSRLKLHNGGR